MKTNCNKGTEVKTKCPHCSNYNTGKGRTGDFDGQPDNDFYCIDCDDYFLLAIEGLKYE